MPIKKESLAKILVKIGAFADETKAIEAISSETETDISIPEGTRIYSKIEWEGDGTDQKPGVEKTLQSSGIKIGKDLLVKDLKEKHKLDFEGKDPDKFLEAFKASVLKEEGASVDEKVKSRDKTINELKEALNNEKTARQQAEVKYSQKEKDDALRKHLPKNRDPRFTDEQYLRLLKDELEFTEEEGKPIVKKNGNVLKDEQFNTRDYASVIAEHFTASKWIADDSSGGGGEDVHGRGGGNGKPPAPGKFANTKEFREYLEKNNIPFSSQQANELLQKAMADNKDFDPTVI